jgi:hypothetical protein
VNNRDLLKILSVHLQNTNASLILLVLLKIILHVRRKHQPQLLIRVVVLTPADSSLSLILSSLVHELHEPVSSTRYLNDLTSSNIIPHFTLSMTV